MIVIDRFGSVERRSTIAQSFCAEVLALFAALCCVNSATMKLAGICLV